MSVTPLAVLVLLLGPLAAGLAFTICAAFGYFPALGETHAGWYVFASAFAEPGVARSVTVTLFSGFAATLASVCIAVGFCASAGETRIVQFVRHALAPVLAMPHAAVAFGFAFLIAPSGLLARFLSTAGMGWDRPPDIATVGDPAGIALVLGLVLKEAPFLVLGIFAACAQIPVGRILAGARTLGYRPATAWLKTILPRVYPQLRLPVYAVLVYSMSVVDVASILGPSNPPTLAVLAVRWWNDPLLLKFLPGAAAATFHLLLALGALTLWRGGEILVAELFKGWLVGGRRGRVGEFATHFLKLSFLVVLAVALAAVPISAIWSFATAWQFPEFLPDRWTMSIWRREAANISSAFATTLSIATPAALVAVLLTILCLESESRGGHRWIRRALWLLYVPLLVPDISFLIGAQAFFAAVALDGMWIALLWIHLLFVVPYVYLVLADTWRALDPRLALQARCLGAGPWRTLIAVKLPSLVRPLAICFAVGFSVSVSLYLPTVLVGAGRHASLTTEAVMLASGGDRRTAGAYALLQALLPLLIYAAALVMPVRFVRKGY